jgi:Protein of unknown function (DUF1638)
VTSKAKSGAKTGCLVVACGALAREIVALKTLNKWGDERLAVTCLPAIWHNRPERIPEGVRAKIRWGKKRFAQVLVLYGDCGTGGMLDAVLKEEGVERIDGPHCYDFYAGHANFEKLMDEELGSFFLTDYLVRHFDRLILEGMGLVKHPELRDAYFGNYRRLVYLAQTEDERLTEKAERAARRLGLEFERRFTGYGELGRFLKKAAGPTG